MSANSRVLKKQAPAQAIELRELLHIRWILTSLLVILAAIVMVRLGFWQLDRLQQRRDHNSRLSAGLAQPPLNLNQALPPDLTDMEYRSVQASGTYEPSQEILLRNQFQDGQPGYHLVTPLLLDGTRQTVLVDRGWIPLDQGAAGKRKIFEETGTVNLKGVLRRSQPEPSFLAGPDPQLAAGQTHQDAWSYLNLERIGQQLPDAILPVYIAVTPDPSKTSLPQPAPLEVDLSEGPHLGYAIQWFIFASILLMGYPFYVRKQLRHPSPRL